MAAIARNDLIMSEAEFDVLHHDQAVSADKRTGHMHLSSRNAAPPPRSFVRHFNKHNPSALTTRTAPGSASKLKMRVSYNATLNTKKLFDVDDKEAFSALATEK